MLLAEQRLALTPVIPVYLVLFCVGVSLIKILLCSSQDNNEFYTEWEESYDSFDQMQLHENLLRGIYAYGADPASISLYVYSCLAC